MSDNCPTPCPTTHRRTRHPEPGCSPGRSSVVGRSTPASGRLRTGLRQEGASAWSPRGRGHPRRAHRGAHRGSRRRLQRGRRQRRSRRRAVRRRHARPGWPAPTARSTTPASTSTARSTRSEEDFDRIIAVDVKGTWLCLREEIRAMRREGRVDRQHEQRGRVPRDYQGLGAYQATKHAVIGFTRPAAHDNGPFGIRVNVVAPGPTETRCSSSAARRSGGRGAPDRLGPVAEGRHDDRGGQRRGLAGCGCASQSTGRPAGRRRVQRVARRLLCSQYGHSNCDMNNGLLY